MSSLSNLVSALRKHTNTIAQAHQNIVDAHEAFTTNVIHPLADRAAAATSSLSAAGVNIGLNPAKLATSAWNVIRRRGTGAA